MKRTINVFSFLLITCIITSFSWKADTDYSGLLDAETKANFLASTSSDLLKTNLTEVFSNFFDEVEKVDIHEGAERGYYYTVYGKKSGIATAKRILVTKEMTEHQYFPNRAQLGMEADAVNRFCFWNKDEDTGLKTCQETGSTDLCGIIVVGAGPDADECSDFNVPIPVPTPIGIIWIRLQ